MKYLLPRNKHLNAYVVCITSDSIDERVIPHYRSLLMPNVRSYGGTGILIRY
jgi:hypothetical protein